MHSNQPRKRTCHLQASLAGRQASRPFPPANGPGRHTMQSAPKPEPDGERTASRTSAPTSTEGQREEAQYAPVTDQRGRPTSSGTPAASEAHASSRAQLDTPSSPHQSLPPPGCPWDCDHGRHPSPKNKRPRRVLIWAVCVPILPHLQRHLQRLRQSSLPSNVEATTSTSLPVLLLLRQRLRLLN